MSGFRFSRETLDLPPGAFAQGWRWILCHEDAPVAGLTQGTYRAYLHPLFSPGGVMVTSESPADHPHHNGIWIAADHVTVDLGVPGEHSDVATYNFYVNDTFQGRAPGRIREVGIEHSEIGEQQIRIDQELEWRGPAEWGNPDGRVVLKERRATTVTLTAKAVVIDISSELTALTHAVTVGPTRHALFGIRLSEALSFGGNGKLTASDGVMGADGVSGGQADWIDYSGPAGHGHRAGVAVLPSPDTSWAPWFATDWGTIALNPVGSTGIEIQPQETVGHAVRILAHDGLDHTALASAWETYRQ
jgi:hypothetical protein